MNTHSKHQVISFEELQNIEPPAKTSTYFPVAHSQFYQLCCIIGAEFDLPFKSDKIEISKNGDRAYIQIHFEHNKNKDYQLTVAFRSAYDKSASIGVASGPSIIICSNQIIHGEDITVYRKHTKNIMIDLEEIIRTAIQVSLQNYEKRISWVESKKETILTKKQGLIILGAARTFGILSNKTLPVALDHWNEPVFEQFKNETNLFGIYQALTWAFHKERPGLKLELYKKLKEFINSIETNENADLLWL